MQVAKNKSNLYKMYTMTSLIKVVRELTYFTSVILSRNIHNTGLTMRKSQANPKWRIFRKVPDQDRSKVSWSWVRRRRNCHRLVEAKETWWLNAANPGTEKGQAKPEVDSIMLMFFRNFDKALGWDVNFRGSWLGSVLELCLSKLFCKTISK